MFRTTPTDIKTPLCIKHPGVVLSIKRLRRTVIELEKVAIHDYVTLLIKDFNKEVGKCTQYISNNKFELFIHSVKINIRYLKLFFSIPSSSELTKVYLTSKVIITHNKENYK